MHLAVLKKIPEDIEKTILAILQTTYVPDFNNCFKQLGLSLKKISPFKMTYDELLTSAKHAVS